MTEKELKKMNRYQLLELLIIQTERADELEKELKQVQQQLEEQNIQINRAGSIAAASLQISGVFDAADKAANLYYKTVKEKINELQRSTEEKAERILKNAQEQANDIIASAEREAARIKGKQQ